MKRWQWLVALMVSLLGTVAQAAPFYASKDGSMVWDEATGLVWARCSLGQKWTGKTCAGDASRHSFDDAHAAAKDFNSAGGLGGAKDWVVPAIRQLISLRACSNGWVNGLRDLQDGGEPVPPACADQPVQPTIHPMAFPGTPVIGYWSSSAATGDDARLVFFGDGSTYFNFRSGQRAVRVVRAVQLLGTEAALAFPHQLPVFTEADWIEVAQASKVREVAREAVEKAREIAKEVAEKERRAALEAAEQAAKAAAVRKTLAAGAQGMYLQAAQKQRSGDTGEAGRLYELIMEHFPKDPFAVKAADQLTALMGVSRTESAVRGAAERSAQAQREVAEAQRQSADAQRQSDRNASSRSACFSEIRRCESICRGLSGNVNSCIGGCQRSCN